MIEIFGVINALSSSKMFSMTGSRKGFSFSLTGSLMFSSKSSTHEVDKLGNSLNEIS